MAGSRTGLLCVALAVLAVLAAPPSAQELDAPDLARWREHIRPAASETAYEAIPWIPSFAEGVRAANAARKPLLFWAMNGHPLGCT